MVAWQQRCGIGAPLAGGNVASAQTRDPSAGNRLCRQCAPPLHSQACISRSDLQPPPPPPQLVTHTPCLLACLVIRQMAVVDVLGAALRIMRIPADVSQEVLDLLTAAGAAAIGLD